MKRFLPLLLFVAGWALWAYLRPPPPYPEVPPPAGPHVEQALAALAKARWPDQAGRTIGLADGPDRVRVINFWATWCPPCRAEMPAFSRVHERFADKGVSFVGIGIDTADKIMEFAKNNPVSYPLVLGQHETLELTGLLGNGPLGLPFTMILDRSGRLDSVQVGRLSEAELERRILRALAAEGSPR
ncbi:MAG: TlpA family protein disulfide reductase [Rhodocyclaceae bacterium]|nr:TlpA family protein disulfide reductase [Rhodocyclaceae bacterium]